ncbi:hypothetical protein [Skermania piniformis]|nr:hypothetical protein [Skermania piniformis]
MNIDGLFSHASNEENYSDAEDFGDQSGRLEFSDQPDRTTPAGF